MLESHNIITQYIICEINTNYSVLPNDNVRKVSKHVETVATVWITIHILVHTVKFCYIVDVKQYGAQYMRY
jgi:hypothetical protein